MINIFMQIYYLLKIMFQCESRQSLLSVLQQMLIEDTDESVRAATIKSIAINTVYIYDSDKYAQVIIV